MIPHNILISLFGIKKLTTDYGRRHFKLLTNCHVSWDTIYVSSVKILILIEIYEDNRRYTTMKVRCQIFRQPRL